MRTNIIKKIERDRDSTILIYVHDDSMSYNHVPLIYNELKKIGKVKNLDIFLSSPGGDPDAAFKIVKMCREHCEQKLSVIVPFMAKSAATLLAIGTDEIVMGAPSELGPIDPQIYDKTSERWGATQSIRDCVDFVEERFKTTDSPEATSYVLMPIIDKLNPFIVGIYERAVKMSKQYAELLLKNGMLKNNTAEELQSTVGKLSESYYSHGFAIDSKEAKEELYLNVVNCDDELWDQIWALFLTYNLEMRQNTNYSYFIQSLRGMEEKADEESGIDNTNTADASQPNEGSESGSENKSDNGLEARFPQFQ